MTITNDKSLYFRYGECRRNGGEPFRRHDKEGGAIQRLHDTTATRRQRHDGSDTAAAPTPESVPRRNHNSVLRGGVGVPWTRSA
ncbi:hypothetical protein GCM10023193_78260 [Planotetraspora kaengkrachanensis]|uniref:Uncharacterized protein n=1 Tax=Planotetraspora kaengkrachanensis TaxID=575193 RepID=A0A8J3VCP2_9ACTN|nr:hypothetical protein Pka01_78010 [Planotetraspora kaengkrachanensis]